MSSAMRLMVGLIVLLAAPLPAQDVGVLRARLARMHQIQDSLRHEGARSGAAAAREAQRAMAGPVLVAVPSHASPGLAEQVAAAVWEQARTAGLFSRDDLARITLVAGMEGVQLDGRRTVTFSLSSDTSAHVFLTYTVDNATWNLARAILSESWRDYLDANLPLRWQPGRDNLPVIAELKAGELSRTRGCLANAAIDCAAYLGLDESRDPLRYRFTPDDIRLRLARAWAPGSLRPGDPMRRCLEGSDAGCYSTWFAGTLSTPSIGAARQSLVHFIRATHGADVARAMLADSAGTWGSRLRRATGKEPVAIAAEWREWLFASANQQPPTVSYSQAAVTLLVIGLLLAAATRSPRWRV